MTPHSILRPLGTGLILATLIGCASDPNQPGFTDPRQPGPAVGQAVGATVGAVGGNAVGAVVGWPKERLLLPKFRSITLDGWYASGAKRPLPMAVPFKSL